LTEEAGVTVRHEFSLIVGYGTDMGNAEDAAMTFTQALGDIGVDVEAIELSTRST
jgi:sulfite reductase (NADPH) flavoprotein alpha-component